MGVFKLKHDNINAEDLELELIDFGLEELGESTTDSGEEVLAVRCAFNDFGNMQKALEEKNFNTLSAEVEWIPSTPVELNEEQAQEVLKLVDRLEQDEDVQKVFQDKEPIIWEVIRLWHLLYSSKQQLEDDLQEIPVFSSSKVKVKFHQTKPLISEKEKLEVLKMRKDLGLNTQAELIQMDNPDLTMDEAEERALANNVKPIVEPLTPQVNNSDAINPLTPQVNNLDVVNP
jgi:hypothetical protein